MGWLVAGSGVPADCRDPPRPAPAPAPPQLGVPFEVKLEAPHVVDMKRQVWAGVVSTSCEGGLLQVGRRCARDGRPAGLSLGCGMGEDPFERPSAWVSALKI